MNKQPYTYFMAFLSTEGGIDFAEYVRRYQRGEAVSATGLQPSWSADGPIAPAPLDALPPMLDPATDQHEVDPRVLAYVDRISTIALERMRRHYPLLPGEEINADYMTALSRDWHGYPRGTIVYHRTTNRGTIAFGSGTMRIDLGTGKTTYVTELPGPPPEGQIALAVDEFTGTLIDSALTIAQFAGFALGPEGLILSGGAAVLQLLFHKSMSPNKADLSAQIQKVVEAVMVKLNLENADATIATDFNWLKDHYDAAWTNDPAPPSNQEFTDFKQALAIKLQSDNGLIQQVNLLTESDYKIPGFSLFLLGASQVILLHKIDLILKSSDKKVIDTLAYTALCNTLQRYIQHGEATLTEIDGKITKRLGQISGVYRTQQCVNLPAHPGGSILSCNKLWAYDDGSTRHDFPDTEHEDGCKSETIEHKGDAESSRKAYYNKIHAEQNEHFYHGDPAKAHQTVTQWKDMLAKLQSMKA